MAVLVHAEGPDWTRELYQATFDKVIPDRAIPPLGLIAHFATARPDGGWQVIEVWESEEAFRTFVEGDVVPAAKELGAPPFDSKVSEVYNSLIP